MTYRSYLLPQLKDIQAAQHMDEVGAISRLGFLFFELLILLYIPANPLIISKIICKYMWN